MADYEPYDPAILAKFADTPAERRAAFVNRYFGLFTWATAALAVLAVIAVVIPAYTTRNAEKERFVPVDLTVTSTSSAAGGGSDGKVIYVADVEGTFGGRNLVDEVIVDSSTRPGRRVDGYVDTRDGGLWKPTYTGTKSPYTSVTVHFIVAALMAAAFWMLGQAVPAAVYARTVDRLERRAENAGDIVRDYAHSR